MRPLQIRDIIKTENIIRARKGDALSSIGSKLSSTHDSAFVFDDDDKYLGIINPYYCYIKTNFPAQTKVENCLVHAPKINFNDNLPRVARMMIESKIHYLPVFDDLKFAGIISARRLIEAALNQGLYKFPINGAISVKKPIVTLNIEATLGAAMAIFKESKVSKLVIVDKSGRLKGVLTFFDLIDLLIRPKQKPSFNSPI